MLAANGDEEIDPLAPAKDIQQLEVPKEGINNSGDDSQPEERRPSDDNRNREPPERQRRDVPGGQMEFDPPVPDSPPTAGPPAPGVDPGVARLIQLVDRIVIGLRVGAGIRSARAWVSGEHIGLRPPRGAGVVIAVAKLD